MPDISSHLASIQFCYLTTRGRVTGNPHEIEIWFVLRSGVVYVMAGSRRSDWVRNLEADRRVTLRIGDATWAAFAQVHPDQDDMAIREAMAAKYQGWSEDRPLSEWARSATIVAVAPL